MEPCRDHPSRLDGFVQACWGVGGRGLLAYRLGSGTAPVFFARVIASLAFKNIFSENNLEIKNIPLTALKECVHKGGLTPRRTCVARQRLFNVCRVYRRRHHSRVNFLADTQIM